MHFILNAYVYDEFQNVVMASKDFSFEWTMEIYYEHYSFTSWILLDGGYIFRGQCNRMHSV